MQGQLDRADIAIEVALEDPGVFLESALALKNLDRAVRDLTGVCDHLVGHLGMIHHTVKESGMHPGASGLFRVAKANVEPVRQRTQYSCMAASMTMCLKALGYDQLDEDQVNRVMGAQPMKGAAWEQALACAQHYGCRATLTMPATVEQLKRWTDAGVPVMIAWNPEGRPWSHASVVFDVDDDLNVYVADPNIPNPKETVRIVSEADFYGKWYEKFPDYLVRRPACAIEREITVDGKQMRLASTKTALNTWNDPHKSPRGVPYPRSKWDHLGKNSPFRWATPAFDMHTKTYPEPWRVADKDAALALLKHLFPHEKDIYTDYDSHMIQGKLTLWVGLRDNRDKAAHQQRLNTMFATLQHNHLLASQNPRGGNIWLMDDVPKDILRGKHAKGPQTAPKTQEEKRREQNTVTVERSTPRNDAARALAEKGNKGQGVHKNKQDYARGQARNPKHKKPFDREASIIERLVDAAYSGNPDGKPIYPVQVDHGEVNALSGGHDVMKRLQDQLRIEQGGQPRENQETRLALYPSSPKGTKPLSAHEEEEVWNAGYEAASYYSSSGMKQTDGETLFINAIHKMRDRRIPAGISEDHPQFWEYLGTFIDGAKAFASNSGGRFHVRGARWNANTSGEVGATERLAQRFATSKMEGR